MSDSIELYNGCAFINVFNIDYLSEPNQQLANAIATGPQDEFFSKLEECNRCLRDEEQLSVTPSWNWKPGSYNKIQEYLKRSLQLGDKSNGLSKYINRARDNAKYRISWMSRVLSDCEDLKKTLKREGYSYNVDINEYIQKLNSFCNTIKAQCKEASKATDNRVTFTPYIYIPDKNERNSIFYLKCNIGKGELNVAQDSQIIQKIPMNSINIMFYCHLRSMTKYLDNPVPYNYHVNQRGMYDSPIWNYNRRMGQNSYHPYIAKPTRTFDGNVEWTTTCFSNYTDDIRKSFHDLNYVALAMQLIGWASYYNTSHSNPYNQPNEMHFGMPSDYSKAYHTVINRSSSSCSSRLNQSISNGFHGIQLYSKQNIKNRILFLEKCNEIKCIWRDSCEEYVINSGVALRLLNEEKGYKIESILGVLIEEYDETYLKDLLHDDFGCKIWDLVDENESDNVISNWEDVLNRLKATTRSEYDLLYLLAEIHYWGEDKEEPAEEENVPNNDRIKEQMLQWATERSI